MGVPTEVAAAARRMSRVCWSVVLGGGVLEMGWVSHLEGLHLDCRWDWAVVFTMERCRPICPTKTSQ